MNEGTRKVRNGRLSNVGKGGAHGVFRTKKGADAQRRAMFANGYHEGADAPAVRQARMSARMFRDIDSVLKGAGVTVDGVKTHTTNVDGLYFTKDDYWSGWFNDYYHYGTFTASTESAKDKLSELAAGFHGKGFDVGGNSDNEITLGFSTRTPEEVNKYAKDESLEQDGEPYKGNEAVS